MSSCWCCVPYAPYVVERARWCGEENTSGGTYERAKGGVRSSLLTEVEDILLAVEVALANRHDTKWVAATLMSMMYACPVSGWVSKLCLDLGYDYDEVRRVIHMAGFELVILGRHDEKRTRSSMGRGRVDERLSHA